MGDIKASNKINLSRFDWNFEYLQKDFLLKNTFQSVEPFEFYRDLFPVGSFQKKGNLKDGKGNMILSHIRQNSSDEKSKRFLVFDDLKDINKLVDDDFSLISPVSFFGKNAKNINAHELFAFVIDIDYVSEIKLKNLIKQIGNGSRGLAPNYIVSSGKGLHLYFLLDTPLQLYKKVFANLDSIKKTMIKYHWNYTTSENPENPDIAGITQGFRAVGSFAKNKSHRVKAFKVHDKKFFITDFLGNYPVKDIDSKILVERNFNKKYFGNFKSNKKMYEWWKNQISEYARVGGRYYAILSLCSFGLKCGVDDEIIKNDAYSFLDYLESLTIDEDNHFSKQDIDSALSLLDSEEKRQILIKLTRDFISNHSKIEIKKNKRNFRTQELHLKGARAIQEINNPNWRDGNGRKPKRDVVFNFIKSNPNAKKVECIKATKLSKATVYKYYKEFERLS